MTDSYALVYVAGHKDYPLIQGHLPQNDIHWLEEGTAAEILLSSAPSADEFLAMRAAAATYFTDVFLVPNNGQRRKKLLLADMDATIVEEETLDELAASVGLKNEIAAITARAMKGELDFHQALTERVGMLKGLPVDALTATLARMRLTGGARDMVQAMRGFGATCILVSGGFTFFTNAIAERCGFNASHGNTLEIEGGVLTGRVAPPILDKDAKLRFLTEYTQKMGLNPIETMAVGDGANDLPMLLGAGLGIGYRPKPLVKEHVQNCVLYSGHKALLYMQGYSGAEIAQVLPS